MQMGAIILADGILACYLHEFSALFGLAAQNLPAQVQLGLVVISGSSVCQIIKVLLVVEKEEFAKCSRRF